MNMEPHRHRQMNTSLIVLLLIAIIVTFTTTLLLFTDVLSQSNKNKVSIEQCEVRLYEKLTGMKYPEGI